MLLLSAAAVRIARGNDLVHLFCVLIGRLRECLFAPITFDKCYPEYLGYHRYPPKEVTCFGISCGM